MNEKEQLPSASNSPKRPLAGLVAVSSFLPNFKILVPFPGPPESRKQKTYNEKLKKRNGEKGQFPPASKTPERNLDALVPASSFLSNSEILAVFPGPPRSRKQQACVIKELKRKNGETENEFEAWNTLVLRKKNHFDASSFIVVSPVDPDLLFGGGTC